MFYPYLTEHRRKQDLIVERTPTSRGDPNFVTILHMQASACLSKLSVLHLVASLELGGAERSAVNLCNALPQDRISVHLATTRQEGLLASEVASHVERLSLGRKSSLDLRPWATLATYVKRKGVKLIHSHSSTLVGAACVKLIFPNMKLIWHVHHSGFTELSHLPQRYRIPIQFVDAIFVVSAPLLLWTKEKLPELATRCFYLPNFVEVPEGNRTEGLQLPGSPGQRIVCVANLRPEKGHTYLIKAMKQVVRIFPSSHLIMAVGAIPDIAYERYIRTMIRELELDEYITIYKYRTDIPNILQQSDIGVLSSLAEGLPMALLEYGANRLPVAVTDVGHNSEVLDAGRLGVLVPAGEEEQLADAIVMLLSSAKKRATLGNAFHEKVVREYTKENVVDYVCDIYESLLT